MAGPDERDRGDGVADDALVVEPLHVNENPVATARRMYGRGGAFIAAGMLGIEKVLYDEKKTDSVQVQEASSNPVDVDAEGIDVAVDADTTVRAPALEPKPPLPTARRRSRPRR